MCGVPVVRGDDLLADCVGVVGKMEVEERHAQKSYWEEHSKDLTVEAMMLDSRAADLDKEERPEVIHSAMAFSPLPLSIPVFSEYTIFSVLFSASCDPSRSPWIWGAGARVCLLLSEYHLAISRKGRMWKRRRVRVCTFFWDKLVANFVLNTSVL